MSVYFSPLYAVDMLINQIVDRSRPFTLKGKYFYLFMVHNFELLNNVTEIINFEVDGLYIKENIENYQIRQLRLLVMLTGELVMYNCKDWRV